jgi:hypothetical protein
VPAPLKEELRHTMTWQKGKKSGFAGIPDESSSNLFLDRSRI